MSNHATSIKAAKIQLKTEAGIKSFWLSRDTGHSCNTQHTVKWALSCRSLHLCRRSVVERSQQTGLSTHANSSGIEL
ncbi:MAG: hypothetical protein ACJAY6_002871 [Yoonia sp.]|jgi:hypothetical protein